MKKLVMLAGGGTGGHVYPAIAIARALQKLDSNLEIRFVGSSGGLEEKIVPREGYPLHLIAGGKLNYSGQIFQKIKTLIKLPFGLLQAMALLLKYRPAYVLGVGGYASGPFVLAAAMLRFKTGIWEGNAYPGMANRWLSTLSQQCFLVFGEAKKYLSARAETFALGMPVREEIELAQQSSAVGPLPRLPGKFNILHFGGSQGSRAIGRVVCELLTAGGPSCENWQVVHQTGSVDFQKFSEDYQGCQKQVNVQEFIFNMPDYYRWADLVICRGGASTLNELAAFGLPAIVIPLAAADGHQVKNTEELVKGGGAVMILQKDLTAKRLQQEISAIQSQPERRQQMAKEIKKFYRPQAALAIAKEIANQISKS